MKKLNLLLYIFVFQFSLLNSIYGQTAEKGFKYFEQKDYKQALISFKKAISKKKNVTAAKFGLAKVYSDSSYRHYKYSRAYRHIVYVEKKYFKLKPQDAKKLNNSFGINDISIGKLKKKILHSAFVKAMQLNTIESFKDFRLDFPNTEESRTAILLESKLAFNKALKDNRPTSMQQFIRDYPRASQIDSAKKIVHSLNKELFHLYTHEGELDIMSAFEKLYPSYAQTDTFIRLKRLAFAAFKLGINEKYSPDMEEYYLEYVKDAAPAELAYVALLRTLTPYLMERKWNVAIDMLNKHKSYFKNNSRIDTLISILQHSERKINIESISDAINTYGDEYAPVMTPDGKAFYFCGRHRTDNIGGEDIFVSKRKDDRWSKASILKSINSPHAHESPLAISADGSTMLLFANMDIYYSNKQADSWSIPRRFPSINNRNSWEADAMMTADGNAIFFITDRPGNIGDHHPFGRLYHGATTGNTDIYVSCRDKNGKWSKPINLGSRINTPYGERSPFLHPDMKTLYFSSDGHAGLGRLDVFKSERLNDSSWTEWSEPINLGKEINSHQQDYDYRISTDGRHAYLSSLKDGNFNIMKMNLPEQAQPNKVAIISGRITDKAGKPIHAKVKWENIETGKKMGSLSSNIEDGSYMFILPLNKNYGYYIEHKDYYPLSGNIDLRGVNKQTDIKKDFILLSYSDIIEKKLPIIMENIFFETDKYQLKAESFTELDRLIKFLQQNNSLKIEIGGHTDNTGSSQHNQQLSSRRALSVVKYLIAKGVAESRIKSKGYGETKPVASNNNELDKSKNRRVEFKVIN